MGVFVIIGDDEEIETALSEMGYVERKTQAEVEGKTARVFAK